MGGFVVESEEDKAKVLRLSTQALKEQLAGIKGNSAATKLQRLELANSIKSMKGFGGGVSSARLGVAFLAVLGLLAAELAHVAQGAAVDRRAQRLASPSMRMAARTRGLDDGGVGVIPVRECDRRQLDLGRSAILVATGGHAGLFRYCGEPALGAAAVVAGHTREIRVRRVDRGCAKPSST